MGAINTQTGAYVQPNHANKHDVYKCPCCNKDVFIRQGKVRCHHFAHVRSDNPCMYYISPSESQTHKDAKMLMKDLLERKIPISLLRPCTSCRPDIFTIEKITDTSTIQLEYRFNHNGSTKIADVAYIDCDEIYCIFEIYNTHKTHPDNRPEPWFEINATDLIKLAAVHDDDSPLEIPCIRVKICKKCQERQQINEKRQVILDCIDKEHISQKHEEQQIEEGFKDDDDVNMNDGSGEYLYSSRSRYIALHKKYKNIKNKYAQRIRKLQKKLALLDDELNRCNGIQPVTKTKQEKLDILHQEGYHGNVSLPLLVENDIEYTLGNNIVYITHPIFNIKIRRSVVHNKTYYKGKWRTDFPVSKIITWYKNEIPLEELLVR